MLEALKIYPSIYACIFNTSFMPSSPSIHPTVEFNIRNTSTAQVGQFHAQRIFRFHIFFPFVRVYAMLISLLSLFALFPFPSSSVTCI